MSKYTKKRLVEAVAQIVERGSYPSSKALGNYFSVSRQAIYEVFKRIGLKPCDIAAQLPPSPFVKAVRALAKNIDTSKLTALELANQTGFEAIELPSMELRTYQIPFKRPDFLKSQEFIAAVKASNLDTKTLTAKQIAKAVGYPDLYDPNKTLRIHGIPYLRSKSSVIRKKKDIPKSKLAGEALKLGDTSNMTAQQICAKTGIHIKSPGTTLKRHGIPFLMVKRQRKA